MRRHTLDAFEILNGTGSPIAACNLLAAIECGDVSVDQLPVSLKMIETAAGRQARMITQLSFEGDATGDASVK